MSSDDQTNKPETKPSTRKPRGSRRGRGPRRPPPSQSVPDPDITATEPVELTRPLTEAVLEELTGSEAPVESSGQLPRGEEQRKPSPAPSDRQTRRPEPSQPRRQPQQARRERRPEQAPRQQRPPQPRPQGSPVGQAIEQVTDIIDALKKASEEMEEILEILEDAERQQKVDERELGELRRRLSQLHRNRDELRPRPVRQSRAVGSGSPAGD